MGYVRDWNKLEIGRDLKRDQMSWGNALEVILILVNIGHTQSYIYLGQKTGVCAKNPSYKGQSDKFSFLNYWDSTFSD